jgi:hypothetical protein
MKKAILDTIRRIELFWLVVALSAIIFELVLVPYFVPTLTIQTPQEEQYLFPWSHNFNASDFPANIGTEVHNLVFPDRATPRVNDAVVYSFNITNLTNKAFEVNQSLNVVSPNFESFADTTVTVEGNATAILSPEEVIFKNEGMNKVVIVFHVPSYTVVNASSSPTLSVDNLTISHYVWTVTQQTENFILFGKYGQILTFIVLIPTTIIALKNFKDLVTKPKKEE